MLEGRENINKENSKIQFMPEVLRDEVRVGTVAGTDRSQAVWTIYVFPAQSSEPTTQSMLLQMFVLLEAGRRFCSWRKATKEALFQDVS